MTSWLNFFKSIIGFLILYLRHQSNQFSPLSICFCLSSFLHSVFIHFNNEIVHSPTRSFSHCAINNTHTIKSASSFPHSPTTTTTTTKTRETPLVLYPFTLEKSIQDLFIGCTQSGSICINDSIMQYVGKILNQTKKND